MSAHLIADLAAFITAGIAVIGGISYFFLRKTKTTNEVVDGPVLVEFRQLLERVVTLELRLTSALDKIADMERTEAYLEGQVHDREKRIVFLEEENKELKERVEHLEQVCRRAGINGVDLNGNAT